MKKPLRKIWKVLFVAGILAVVSGFVINIYMVFYSESYIYNEIRDVLETKVVLVLGARVYESGTLSDALKDRVLSAIELYDEGKVEKFLLSGDHSEEEYDEVNTMKDFLLEKGIDGDDIFLDHAGFDTYDSIYRAKEIFGVDSCVIVTQAFHLPRAVYIARKIGVDAYGFIADKQEYREIVYYEFREMVARSKSFFDVLFSVSPKFLGEKISIEGSGKVTWD